MKLISEKNYRREMETVVFPFLRKHRRDLTITGYDQKPLFASFFDPSPAAVRGSVSILHGFTESIEKYAELIYYFLKEGYAVGIYEQRGHGRSYRRLSDTTMTHVGRFEEYVWDFAAFTKYAGKELPAPHFLFAHSMGGAVAALYLERYRSAYRKVVLSSPMIAPQTNGLPRFAVRALAFAAKSTGKSEKRIFSAARYPGREYFADGCASSRARFEFYESFKRSHALFRNYSPTYGWLLAAVGVTGRILKRGEAEKIAPPVMIYTAENDRTVRNRETLLFASRLANGSLTRVRNTRHEIYMAENPTLGAYLRSVFAFLRS